MKRCPRFKFRKCNQRRFHLTKQFTTEFSFSVLFVSSARHKCYHLFNSHTLVIPVEFLGWTTIIIVIV